MAVAVLTGLLASSALIPGGTLPAVIMLQVLEGALATALRPLEDSYCWACAGAAQATRRPDDVEDRGHLAADAPK